MSNLEIANTISETIGHKALYMMGAENLTAIDNGLTFKIGRNAGREGGTGGVTHITIKLTDADLYDVDFLACRGTSLKTRAAHEGIYFDMLHELITAETGMALSL